MMTKFRDSIKTDQDVEDMIDSIIPPPQSLAQIEITLSDSELVTELRNRGYSVTALKTIEL